VGRYNLAFVFTPERPFPLCRSIC